MNHLRPLTTFVLLLVSASALRAQSEPTVEMPGGVKIDSLGVIQVGDATIEVFHYDRNWGLSAQHEKFTPKEAAKVTAKSFAIEGGLDTNDGTLNVSERVEAADDGIRYTAAAKAEKALPTNSLAVTVTLPVDSYKGKKIVVDKEPLALPEKEGDQAGLLTKEKVKQIEIPLEKGTLVISGEFDTVVQDNRQWDPDYMLRLDFTPASGDIKDSKIELQFKVNPEGKIQK